MPQLIALALVGAGVYVGYRWVSKRVGEIAREAERRAAEAKAAQSRAGEPQDRGALEWDADAGVYRPKR
ncbi:MAG: hypothetical protein KDJ36_14105 [Hyphomicrobiaceae bacterium]|nr:hypothetical protein [Hyphomicrobiaceae bacterium]